jgi:hypothetical protein
MGSTLNLSHITSKYCMVVHFTCLAQIIQQITLQSRNTKNIFALRYSYSAILSQMKVAYFLPKFYSSSSSSVVLQPLKGPDLCNTLPPSLSILRHPSPSSYSYFLQIIHPSQSGPSLPPAAPWSLLSRPLVFPVFLHSMWLR